MRGKAAQAAARGARFSQAMLWLPIGYLAVLTAAALWRRARLSPSDARHRFVVVVPAHNEEESIEASVSSLIHADYPAEKRRVLVVADNCSDATAERARRAGADVWERHDLMHVGKGAAVRFAVEGLLGRGDWDTLAVIDADTQVNSRFLSALDTRLSSGATVVQGENLVANPAESVVTRLAEVSFAIQSVLRQRGRAALGAAAKLQGNGMAFKRSVLEREGWEGTGLAEDIHAWLLLVSRGIRPSYEPNAAVAGTMPATREAARVQRSRWEAGRIELARAWVVPGLRQALRRRDPVLLEALVSELVFPPLSTLVALVTVAGVVRFAADRPLRSAAAQVGVLGSHAVVALAVCRAPASSYGALLLTPLVVVWKSPSSWIWQ